MRWFFVLACLLSCCSFAASPSTEAPKAEAAGLRSVAGWLRANGVDGYLGADVADAMGITRGESEDLIDAKQRGFRSEQTLRMAQLLDRRGLILFMVEGPGGVSFYLSTVGGGLRKALVYLPAHDRVVALDALEAQADFRREVLYWEERAAQ
jgi:hypothetical protein